MADKVKELGQAKTELMEKGQKLGLKTQELVRVGTLGVVGAQSTDEGDELPSVGPLDLVGVHAHPCLPSTMARRLVSPRSVTSYGKR